MKFNGIKLKQKNNFLNMFEANYTNNDGGEKQYEVVSRNMLTDDNFGDIKKANAVAIFALDETEEKILLLKEFRMACNQFVYNIPGGLIDDGETACISAIRELKEETGLDLYDITETLAPAYTAVGITDELVATVIGKAKGNFEKSTSADEEIEAGWYTKEEVNQLIKDGCPMTLRTQTLLWMWAKQ